MKTVIACGCSITHGYFVNHDNKTIINDSYADLFAKRNNHDIVNLSKPGSSNYFIAKQAEYGISLNPDFIIVGLTSGYRFDYQEDASQEPLWQTPNIKQWGYKKVSKTTHTNEHGIYNSNPIPRLNAFDHKKEFVNYILKYVNADIKADQDRYIVSGMIYNLQASKIPFVIVDWTNLLETKDTRVIKSLVWHELNKKFPTDKDGTHFDQQGQQYASEQLEEYIKTQHIWRFNE